MLSGVISDMDANLFLFLNAHHTPALDLAFLIITTLGSGWVVAPAVLLALVRNTRGRRARTLAAHIAVAMCAAWLTNAVLKRIVDRPRPIVHFSNLGSSGPGGPVRRPQIRVIGGPHEDASFPSGHASAACSAAAVLVLLWGRRYAWAVLAAGLVSYSRVYLGVHFPADVVAGAILGGLVTLAVLELSAARRLVRDG